MLKQIEESERYDNGVQGAILRDCLQKEGENISTSAASIDPLSFKREIEILKDLWRSGEFESSASDTRYKRGLFQAVGDFIGKKLKEANQIRLRSNGKRKPLATISENPCASSRTGTPRRGR